MPGPDPALVDLFRSMRQDARSEPKPAELARPFVITMTFDGANQLPTLKQSVLVDLGQIRARIIGASIIANGVGSATIDLRHGTFADVPSLGPLYGAAIPTLTLAAATSLDVSTWTLNLQPSDVLIGLLKTVSSVIAPPAVGSLTCVALTLYCRHLKWPAGSATVTDSSGDRIVDSFGNVVTTRS